MPAPSCLSPESDEAMQFSFNPQAADFVPNKCPSSFNPDAAEFVPNLSPSVLETPFSDEEEKLLGAQLCRDLEDFGAEGRPESSGSAQASAGEETGEIGEEETEEEEDRVNHIALATAEAIIG